MVPRMMVLMNLFGGRNGDTDIGNSLMDMVGGERRRWDEWKE